jgi:excisionase family DNA binding protein
VPTIYRLTQNGKLPAYHVGRSRRYRREDLDGLPQQLTLPT